MHILIIYPQPYYNTNPTLAFIIDRLGKENHITTTMVIPSQNEPLPAESKNLIYLNFRFQVTWPRKVWKWGSIIYEYFTLIQYAKKNKIRKIISVDPEGLIVGGRISRFMRKADLHYFSFEILFWDEMVNKRNFQKIKEKEVYYTKMVDTLVIQDEVRMELIFKENKIKKNQLKVNYIPVAPSSLEPDINLRREHRKELGISDEEIVLIHSGSVAKWSGAELLIELLKKGLPQDYKLLIHCRYKLSEKNSLHAELIRLQQEGYPLILHDKAFPEFREYLNFLQCADYGLAFYIADLSSPYTGKNIQEIGLASGKFACYMSQGIRTIVTSARIYEVLNQKYGFGFIVRDADQLKELLSDNKSLYIDKKNIHKLYYNELDPEKCGNTYINTLIVE